jgi:Domain of unknown function (4846)
MGKRRLHWYYKNSIMHPNLLMAIILPVFFSCQSHPQPSSNGVKPVHNQDTPYTHVSMIPVPDGYQRIPVPASSFARWLREFPLRSTRTVYLYNGALKANQSAAFAVLDISTGSKDLQQCADAVMRLRAEYFYERGELEKIRFIDNAGKVYVSPPSANRVRFHQYLEQVFSWCGTLSLEKQLQALGDPRQVQPGDVLIKGGSPGHAAIIMDVAENEAGERICLLANSYMPAQDIHVVVNPRDKNISPWISIKKGENVDLPEWRFHASQLRRW